MDTTGDFASAAFRKTDHDFDAAHCAANEWAHDDEVTVLLAAYRATDDATRLGMYDAICDRFHAIRDDYIHDNADDDADHLDSVVTPVEAVLPVWGVVQ